MIQATICIDPIPAGWLVRSEGREPALFLSGARAEAHARRLAQALWQTGVPARVLVHGRNGALMGVWRFGPGDPGAASPQAA